MKTVALSRQARDNHRETDQERHVRRRWQRWTHGDRVSGLQHPAAVLPMKHDDSPRHARDKHKENSRKGWRFAQRTVELTVGGGGSHELAPPQPGAMGAAAAGHGAVVWAGACERVCVCARMCACVRARACVRVEAQTASLPDVAVHGGVRTGAWNIPGTSARAQCAGRSK